jgi:hypothetical protein
MHLKETEKPKNSLFWANTVYKKKPKTQKTQKNQKTQTNPKKPTGLGFFKKKPCFSNPDSYTYLSLQSFS